MRVLVVSANREREPYPVAPLGAAYVAGALERAGHEARILDLCFVEDGSIAEAVADFRPDLIGLSVRNIDNLTYGKSVCYLPGIRRLVDLIKGSSSAPVIAGGSGFSIFPEETLRYLGLAAGIAGEGERAFVMLAEAFQYGGSLDSIPNLCRIVDGRFVRNAPGCVGGFSGPERRLLENSRYMELGGMGNIQTKRGCPFSCSYCTYPAIEGRELRLRPADEVAEELKEARLRDGVGYFFFVDDIFNFPEGHAMAVCEELIRREAGVDWTCFATPLGMTAEMAGLMKRAGCRGVEFGSDGGSEKTLAALGKGFSVRDIAHAVSCCAGVDLPNAHYIIMGGPGEDMDTIRETFGLFDRVRPTAVIALMGVRIYPDTPLRQRAVWDGVITEDQSLLEPAFYLTRSLSPASLVDTVAANAADRFNWVVPALDMRCDAGLLALLRKRGKRGPLWDLLS
jgi:radical SAM superfamily enzyme YgiQ (UPF0313 family)